MSEKLRVYSKKTGNIYDIVYLKTFNIETSMDVPADAFEVVTGNPDYQVSDVISSGDKILFYINEELAIEGYIDDLDVEYTKDSNNIRITGRDELAILLDNDALPKTYNKLGLKDYMSKVLPGYGVKFDCDSNSAFKKITISAGENQYGIVERLAKERNLKPIYNIKEGRLDVKKPISTKDYTYYFSNTSPYGIKMLDCQITISNDITNEVIVYGGSDKKQIKGSYIDNSLKTRKRKILNESDIEKVSDAQKRAKEEFYNINKNALIVKISTPTKKPIYINKCARVKIDKINFDAYLLVDSVNYRKSIDSGSITDITLKLMPNIQVNFNYNDIPKLPEL
jgi:prophage tail gpP-like protein